MVVKIKSRKISKSFFAGDMQNMIRDNFKPVGWTTYEKSPYKEYQRKMEELGYVRTRNN